MSIKNLKTFRNSLNLTQKELAKILSLKLQTVQYYEMGTLSPSFKSLKKIIDIFQISFDYFLFYDECVYPRNLKLIRLAKQLDDFSKSDARSSIEGTTKNLLGEKINTKITIEKDVLDLSLSNSFNQNLKSFRNFRNITQLQLAEKLNISRSALALYELKSYPSIDNLIKLSKILNVSSHLLATGERLHFNFNDKYFGDTMLLADRILSFDDQKFLIKLMENIIHSLQPAGSTIKYQFN